MFDYKYRYLTLLPRCVRYISRFRVPRSDCQPLATSTSGMVRSISQFRVSRSDCSPLAPRKVNDPKSCDRRDRGLVLGAYYNEFAAEPLALTAAAQRYDARHGGRLRALLRLCPAPKLGEARVFYDVDPEFAFVAVAGLGSECLAFSAREQLDQSKEAIRVAAGTGARALQRLRASAVMLESFGDAEAAAEGAELAMWQFREYRSRDRASGSVVPDTKIHLYEDCDQDGWNIGRLKAESQNLARFLQEMPANLLNPTSFAKIAVELLCEIDINVEVRTQGWAASHEMGGFVAVGKSSVQPPLYVEISYYGASEKTRPVVLIGKGVTFDSGSLDLKPPEELRYMRGDMAGAACVLAVTRAAARLRLPVNIRGILPLCEVMPNAASPKFGDVVYNANGKSIHIRLPSREGRLLVADSLVYARNYWPQFIIDVGTMSKELLDCLGGAACGAYSNCEELIHYAETASSYTGDRVWRLPLWRSYEERVVDCHTADVANVSRRDAADSAVCAAFLKQFVCDSRWLHLDTYNVAYSKGRDVPYLGRGMTGRPTRTLIQLLSQLLVESKL